MKTILKKAALAAALVTISLSAQAVETHITLYANVDSTLAFQKEDGSALPDNVKLDYLPGIGLRPWTEMTRIFTNDEKMDIDVKLGSEVALKPAFGNTGASSVPMTVSLNGVKLTTTASEFKADQIFSGGVTGASIAMPLVVEQATKGVITAGLYEGMANIVMVQKTSTP